jgi:hypothetical protein
LAKSSENPLTPPPPSVCHLPEVFGSISIGFNLLTPVFNTFRAKFAKILEKDLAVREVCSVKADFLSEEKKFQKCGRILLKRSIRRIEPRQNIAFRCLGKSGVRFARSVRVF